MTTPLATPLSPLETRVLGVLIEKELATPDYYPLTLNALVQGCNQKTSRSPVMEASDAEVQTALDGLKHHTLVMESYGASGRVLRYAHNLPKVLGVGQQVTALLAALMLRGPLTPGELRTACDRLYRFADISSVEAFLEEMAGRAAGALVVRLPRQPGSREHRWAQLLGGPAEAEPSSGVASAAGHAESISAGELASVKSQLVHLREEVGQLRAMVERLYRELGEES
jgi:uncharacterized protein YceH (UPF0502 family)